MLSFTLRPHITALTTLRKLSSSSTISEADLATSVPVCMENLAAHRTHFMINANGRG